MQQILYIFILITTLGCANDWRTATKESAGIAPHPDELNESIVQVYVARTVKWRGYFAVHPWIAWKRKEDSKYTVTHVIGWRARRGLPTVVTEQDLPDRHWFGAKPELINEIRGEKADQAINQLEVMSQNYPYTNQYRAWPGPNSNTYIAHLIRSIPQLEVELPPHAIGKDWLVDSQIFASTASGTGFQASAFGLLGISLGLAEGIEFNVLGLNFGLDFWTPALKLPMIGRVGFSDESI
jgi:hypothetical protein